MHLPRLIPVLLLKDKVLVKSVRFKDYNYIGDPINAVRIFNELQADELIFLDIRATLEGRTMDTQWIEQVGEEAEMPFAVGGGFTSLHQIEKAIAAGAEKVVLGTAAVLRPALVKEAADAFGSSTISVCIDVGKNIWGREIIKTHSGTRPAKQDLTSLIRLLEHNGAGEIIIQSILHDGVMTGYPIPLIKKVAEQTTIPVVALGGAGHLQHFSDAFRLGWASAMAAGSYFIYHGARKGVLLHYPLQKERESIFSYE